jgi:hypothetical protein
MSLWAFQILGSLPAHDAVVGSLSSGLGRDRLVLIVPTEGLSDYKRREKIQSAKSDLASGALIAFPHIEAQGLKNTFAQASENEVTAPLSDPQYIQQTIDLLLKETNQPLITLDAQNRDCLWSTLRVLGADSHDLFAVAELGALKPEAKTKRVSKPIGEAHILCGDILKYRDRYTYSDHSPAELINMIRRSVKVKLPSVDTEDQAMGSYFMRELESNTHGHPSVRVNRFFDKVKMRLPFSKISGAEVIFHRDHDGFAKAMGESIRKYDFDGSYSGKHSNLPRMNVMRGDPQEVLTRVFRQEYQFDADTFDFNTLLQKFDIYGFDHLQFRAGIHKPPYDLTLFEMDLTKGEKGKIGSYSTLVLQEETGLTAYTFLRHAGDGEPYFLCDRKMHVTLDSNAASKMAFINTKTGKISSGSKNLAFNNTEDLAFMQALSGIARMNEPGFAPTTYETGPRGNVNAAKGKFPYFDYVGMDSFGGVASHVQVSTKGSLEPTDSVMRRHLVRGHPRRFRDDEGNIVRVIVVPMHMRGDERLGFVSKSHELK